MVGKATFYTRNLKPSTDVHHTRISVNINAPPDMITLINRW